MTPGGGLGEALRNLQRYVDRESFDNPQGGGQFGPELQFDTKGVEFGPWVRRFIAQVRRNWIPMIPYSAMSLRGHVVITFNVHRNGLLTDVTVVGPSQYRCVQLGGVRLVEGHQPDAAAAGRVPVRPGVFHPDVLLQRNTAAVNQFTIHNSQFQQIVNSLNCELSIVN